MSDIRFNNWYHQSGTGGVTQTSNGSVGIGSTVPTAQLDVVGSISATTIDVAGTISATTIGVAGTISATTIGVGSTNPTSILDIIGEGNFSSSTSATPTLTLTNSGGAGSGTGTGAIITKFVGDSDSLVVQNIAGGDYGIYNEQQNNGIEFYDGTGGVIIAYNGSASLTANNSGLVADVTTTFNNLVNIRGNMDLADNDILRFGSGDDCELFCNGSNMFMDLNSGINNFLIRDGTTTRFTFDDNGDFTITGSYFNPGYDTAADNTANVRMASGSGKISRISSSRSIKTDIETINTSTAYNFLNNANPVEFTSLLQADGDGRLFGFIAEEMDEIEPLLTEYEQDGVTPLSVKYGAIPAVLTKIIQLQEERIRTLETQVQQLLDQSST